MIKSIAKKLLTNKQCNLCENKIYKFLPLNKAYVDNLGEKGFPIPVEQFETLNYEAYNCPSCGANDRDRLIGYYLKEIVLGKGTIDLLEIAPAIGHFIRRQAGVRYRTADLYMEGVDDKVDIQNMDIYKDNMFDVVICSHVLEHIPDDVKALTEMYRILKPGGQCIMLVPIPTSDVKYDEDLGEIPTEERERRFGQDDHVRLYTGRIFEERIRKAGFELEKVNMKKFSVQDLIKHGISPDSVLYVGKKKAS